MNQPASIIMPFPGGTVALTVEVTTTTPSAADGARAEVIEKAIREVLEAPPTEPVVAAAQRYRRDLEAAVAALRETQAKLATAESQTLGLDLELRALVADRDTIKRLLATALEERARVARDLGVEPFSEPGSMPRAVRALVADRDAAIQALGGKPGEDIGDVVKRALEGIAEIRAMLRGAGDPEGVLRQLYDRRGEAIKQAMIAAGIADPSPDGAERLIEWCAASAGRRP